MKIFSVAFGVMLFALSVSGEAPQSKNVPMGYISLADGEFEGMT
jgi:hypothetical protein